MRLIQYAPKRYGYVHLVKPCGRICRGVEHPDVSRCTGSDPLDLKRLVPRVGDQRMPYEVKGKTVWSASGALIGKMRRRVELPA